MGAVMEAKRELLDVRLSAGFETQVELAQAASVDKSTVWLAENGRLISRKSATKIIHALRSKGADVKVEDLTWVVSNTKR